MRSSTSSSRGTGSVRPRTGSRRHSPQKSRPILFQLRDLGITPKAAEAVVAWAVRHGIDTDWSMAQLAKHGECNTSTISRAKKALFKAGLIQEIRPAVFHACRSKENQAAVFRFSEKLYQLIFSRPRRHAACTSPLAFENHSESTPQPKQEHKSSRPARAAEAEPQGEILPTVKALMDEGLGRGGAEAVAKALPSEIGPELLPYVLEATRERVSRRSVRTTVEALKVTILRAMDPDLLAEAKRRYKASQRPVGPLTWDSLAQSFRSAPGAREALEQWLQAKEALQRTPEGHPGYLTQRDFLSGAQRRLVTLAIEAGGPEVSRLVAEVDLALAATDLVPGSMAWNCARGLRINPAVLRWIGLQA